MQEGTNEQNCRRCEENEEKRTGKILILITIIITANFNIHAVDLNTNNTCSVCWLFYFVRFDIDSEIIFFFIFSAGHWRWAARLDFPTSPITRKYAIPWPLQVPLGHCRLRLPLDYLRQQPHPTSKCRQARYTPRRRPNPRIMKFRRRQRRRQLSITIHSASSRNRRRKRTRQVDNG